MQHAEWDSLFDGMDDEDDADTGHSADSAGLVDGAREAAQHAQQQRRPPPPICPAVTLPRWCRPVHCLPYP